MKRACVVGWPVAHSRSPLIHGYWLERYGVEGSYTKEAVRPENATRFFEGLPESGFAGCNVTLPHKETAFAAARERDNSAVAAGAANTVWHEAGRLFVSNTDTYGYMTYLSLIAPEWRTRDAPVAVLGAGGAARAIVHGFLEAGVGEIAVFGRTAEKRNALARHFGNRVKAYDWTERNARSAGAGVVVNTTSIGLGDADGAPIDVAVLRPDAIVSDIVYAPLETKLLGAARARGMKTVDGLGMLLHQAVPGFEKWFGVRPEVTAELYELIASDIEGRSC